MSDVTREVREAFSDIVASGSTADPAAFFYKAKKLRDRRQRMHVVERGEEDGDAQWDLAGQLLGAVRQQPPIAWAWSLGAKAPSPVRRAVAQTLKALAFECGPEVQALVSAVFGRVFGVEHTDDDSGELTLFDLVQPRVLTNSDFTHLGWPAVRDDEYDAWAKPLVDAQKEVFRHRVRGGLRDSLGSAMFLARTFPDVLPGALEFNEMTGLVTVGRKEIQDVDVTAFRTAVEARFSGAKGAPITLGKECAWDALIAVAREKPYHPVREYLRSLEWDGVERLGSVPQQVLGADDPTGISSVMYCKWQIAAVARAEEPGCKADPMLVLIGGQGTGKSTFFEKLAGSAWFSDAPVDFDDRDSLMIMRKAWIIEWSEMNALVSARSQEGIKAGITRRVDRYRPPYGRADVDVARGCVFGGSTNDETFLRDPTGNRRFLPIVCGEVNIERLLEWRDQLWAEAYALYKEGEPWHFTDADEIAEVREIQEQAREQDVWTPEVEKWLGAQLPGDVITTGAILTFLGIPTVDQKPDHQARIKKIMVGLGLEEKRPRTGQGSRPRVWRQKEQPSRGAGR